MSERGAARLATATDRNPFWMTTTGMPTSIEAFARSAASASSALAVTMARSGLRVRTGEALTCAVCSPHAPLSRRPFAAIAARCSPRAVTSTEWPALSSSAAIVPPTAPAPMTATLMLRILVGRIASPAPNLRLHREPRRCFAGRAPLDDQRLVVYRFPRRDAGFCR
jgi:hypothetical protein